jgi:N-acetylneuraminic acid mutarotase
MNKWRLVIVLSLCSVLALGVGGCDDLTTATTVAGETTATPPASDGATTDLGVTTTVTEAPTTSITEAPTTTSAPAPEITTTTAAPPTTTATTAGPSVWVYLHPDGPIPAAREGAAMVCNPNTGRVVMFGGYDWVTYYDDLWVYNPEGNAWIALSPAGSTPSGRSGHTLVYDTVNKKILLFGGRGSGGDRNDLWSYDPPTDTWTQLMPAGGPPPTRSHHCAFYDPVTAKMYVFGGRHGGSSLGDLWAYDPAANTWTALTPAGDTPAARQTAGMAYNPGSGRAFLWGGYNGVDLDDAWAYDPPTNQWIEIPLSGDAPAGRSFSPIVYNGKTKTMIMFGGWQYEGEIQRDTWAFKPSTGAWTELPQYGQVPDARSGHAMTYATGVKKIILFGGTNDEWLFDDLWAYGPED